jgi:hypothetical protein
VAGSAFWFIRCSFDIPAREDFHGADTAAVARGAHLNKEKPRASWRGYGTRPSEASAKSLAGPLPRATLLNSRGSASARSHRSLYTVLARNIPRRIAYNASAQSSAHPNRGISIHVFRSNHMVGSRGLLVDSRKGTCRCSNLLNNRFFLLAIGSVKLRAKFH